MISNRWVARWIDRLTDLPAEAPEWAMIANFLETATAIATEKLRQQKEAGIRQLRLEITQLTANCAAELQVFGMGCDHWYTGACAPLQAAEIAPQVALLRSSLAIYRQLDQEALAPSTGLTERRDRRKRLAIIEEEIERLYGNLDPILRQATDAPATGGEEHGVSPQEESPGNLQSQVNAPQRTHDSSQTEIVEPTKPNRETDRRPAAGN